MSENSNRLAIYSSMAITVLAATSAESQIVYTDIDPDSIISYSGEEMFIDMNDDGIDDLSLNATFGILYISTSYGVFYYSTNELIATPLAGAAVAKTADLRLELFEPGKEFDSSMGILLTVLPTPVASLSDYEPVYLGIHFTDGAGAHNGWVRLVEDAGEVRIMDYAYELTDGTPIIMHAPNTPLPVTDLEVTDAGDLQNPSDIQIAFTVPDDESAIASYRVIVSPFGYIPLSDANALTSAAYTEVFPDGTDKTFTINAGQVDNFGDPIEEFDWLNVYVESVSNLKPEESALVHFQNAFIYGHQTDTVRNIVPEQIDAASAWNSIRINFTSPADLDGIINFFSFVVPADELPVTDSLLFYTSVNNMVLNKWEVATGEFHPLTDYVMTASWGDIDGNPIQYGIPYGVCIQSHTLWAEYSDFQYENLACSGPFTLIDPDIAVDDIILNSIHITPIDHFISVDLPATILLPAKLQIFDMMGQSAAEFELNSYSSHFTIELPQGSYIAIVKTEDQNFGQKFLIAE